MKSSTKICVIILFGVLAILGTQAMLTIPCTPYMSLGGTR